ncbi:hypothetical protein VB264_24670 [Arcicella aquatica]|uniref:Uncharacterized protein n=1 Tax=Arcicella aquatica TaxID=217141 RepID=A0ABU5QV80_9BACT|nr:hypothetical protein [Arcicella aquatica]MEA5261015.1 hypothetical protein [Arcicella aquatica]
MEHITRQTFLQQCFGLGTLAVLSPIMTYAQHESTSDENFYQQIVQANNKEVAKLLTVFSSDITEIRRRLGFDLANLAAGYAESTSQYYQKEELVIAMTKIIRFILKAQQADGTLNLGNLASPPDTAFILEPLCVAATIFKHNTTPILATLKELLKEFILKAGESLRVGGIHTPNHRWVVSAALAQINDLFPNPAYVKRIDEWLSENIYIDSDGHYLERSMIYAEVTDRCLITMARLLKRPTLLEPVRKNLNLTYFYIEPNGDLVTTDSRRQDQFMTINVLNHYHDYRYLAIKDNNAAFASITKFIEKVKGFDEKIMVDLLPFCLEEPTYLKPLPTPKAPSVNFEKFFKTTNLVRIRKNDTTSTIFGGADFPIIIASGRSTNSNLFAFRKGEAILKYLRFSTDFFSTGYFRSQGITYQDGKYILHQRIEAPYYQPLPKQFKKANGDYKHAPSTDGRFWNKMDFEHRPQSNVKIIDTTISIEEKDGINELIFSSKGTDGISVTIEFCFKEGGQLTGVKEVENSPNNYLLAGKTGEYTYGKDTIKFGQGINQHTKIKSLEGEMYSSHFGTLKTDGMYVYLTGITPFEHKITIG